MPDDGAGAFLNQRHSQSMLGDGAIKKRELGSIVLLMIVTLGFYAFYLIPDFGRGVNAVVGKRKYSFAVTLALGILTLGLAFSVFEVLFAYDFERYGRESGFGDRVSSLGDYVLFLNISSLLVCFLSVGVAFLVSFFLGVWATWLLQKELNFLADRQSCSI